MTLLTALETWRCSKCGRILLEFSTSGLTMLRKKCDRCNMMNTLEIRA